ncbi:MAG: 30S ribosomal protein S20 [Planctomycetes bacterium]|nr:30S ribosomal protein S20 [Planctomycetota bacterium]
MAHTITGHRNIRRNDKRRLRNKTIKSALRTQIRKVAAEVEKKDKTAAGESLKLAYKLLDRAARKGTIHPNNAARHKARLAGRVASLK